MKERGHESWTKERGLYYQEHEVVFLPDLTINGWLSLYEGEIDESRIANFPNAKLAAEIKASPLYKALS